MFKLRTFASWLLLILSPLTLVYPQNSLPHVQRVNNEEKSVERDYVLSYDDMLQLIDKVESGELENRCTFEESEKVKHFLAFLAKEGALPDNSEESLSLDDDIEELLNGEDSIYENAVSFVTPGEYQYLIVPAVLNGRGEVILCKGWLKKQWKHVKHFVKKHKKELIIGAAVIVAAAVVVVAVVVVGASATASSAAAAGAGAAGASASKDSNKKDQKEGSSSTASTHEAPTLKSAIDHQTASFKDNIVQNFQPISGEEGLSWEEKARILGSVSAHGGLNTLQKEIPYHPALAREINEINSNYTFSIPGGKHGAGHPEIDRKFSTDCGYLFANPSQEGDFNSLAYQVLGEKALEHGYYNQAVQNLDKAIEINPTNSSPYLTRGVAHFGLGQYDQSIEDYKQFTSQAETNQPSVSEFSVGFAKGLPKGVYESGEGMLLFLADFATHPVESARQMVDSVSALVDLVHDDEWNVVAQALSPEMHQLVTEWEALSSHKKGELAGYALGKHGADILVPGALAKIVKQGVKGAQELAKVYKNIQMAQETLVLETAAGIGNPAKLAEIVEAGQKTAFFAEELGVRPSEMAQLNETHKLRSTLASKYEHLSLPKQESLNLFEKARVQLKPYQGRYMPESQVREIIEATGIPTFSRPKGIPENYRIKLSDKPGGMKFVHPTDEGTYIRIMPGKAHSKNPSQQKPYVNHRVKGQSFDRHGNIVLNKSEEAHIPLEDFVYRELGKN